MTGVIMITPVISLLRTVLIGLSDSLLTPHPHARFYKYPMNYIYCLFLSALAIPAFAQYSPTSHRALEPGELPVTGPGYYGEAGKTYVLTQNISSERSAIFLGGDVTLDLNGYEITYADAAYENIPNGSFEDGLTGWDVSKAPSATLVDTRTQVFVGERVLSLAAGEEITSPYINLPVADRSYYAFCGVARAGQRVSVYVEDADGNVVYSSNQYSTGTLQGSPVENKSVALGGGFVFAHFKGKPAGNYRIRVKANSAAYIDYIDIRPGVDSGIGIVERTSASGHVDHMLQGYYNPAFYDYTDNYSTRTPVSWITPVTPGVRSTVTIKNGVVRGAVPGFMSVAIQATSSSVTYVLENVKVIADGINSIAVDVSHADISNCYFQVNNPFIINRHGSQYYAVDLRGSLPSTIAHSEFYGGQGCLNIQGTRSEVHDNYFAVRQTVTNHYSIMAGGDFSKIYRNVFEPELGSGVEIYRGNNIHIYENEFHIESSTPTCEYGNEDYSVNAIRLADYNAAWGTPTGAFENRIYGNKFYITGKDFPTHPNYKPVATAVFYSASAGHNYVYDNEVFVDARDPGSKAETNAFYIGGGTVGGFFENNTVTSNVPAFWIANMYGAARDVVVANNTLIKAENANDSYRAIRLGWSGQVAQNISFISNTVVGNSNKLDFTRTSSSHSYSLSWALTIRAVDRNGNPMSGVDVSIYKPSGDVAEEGITDENGELKVILAEYNYSTFQTLTQNPYRVVVGGNEISVTLENDTEIDVLAQVVTGLEQGIETQMIFGPNPVKNSLNIVFPTENKRSVLISDMNSRIHVRETINGGRASLDLSFLSAGVYLLKVTEGNLVYTKKILKY